MAQKCIECGKDSDDFIALLCSTGQVWGYLCNDCDNKRWEIENK